MKWPRLKYGQSIGCLSFVGTGTQTRVKNNRVSKVKTRPIYAVMLLDWNCGIRYGQFSTSSRVRTVTFRYTQILSCCPLEQQFYRVLSDSHRWMSSYGVFLMALMEQQGGQTAETAPSGSSEGSSV